MRRQPLITPQRLPGPPGAPAMATPAQAHPLLRLQQAVGNRAAAEAMDAPAMEDAAPAPSVRAPAAPVPCRGCVGGGKGPVVRR